MLQAPSVPFHLIYSAQDLCGVNGCKWCASMKPWIERNQRKTGYSQALKLDVHAPEFVPAAGREATPTIEIYATPKQPHFVPNSHGGDLIGSDFKRRFQASISARGSSQHGKLKELLNSNVNGVTKEVFGVAQEQSRLETLLREESSAAIDAKAWELATETFNESLIECIPRVVQYSGRVLADDAVQKIDDYEVVMMRMGEEAMDKIMRFKDSVHDPPQGNLLLDMRLDTIATILQTKQAGVKAMEVAKARARAEENALRVEIESTGLIFRALEDQLHSLHREAAHLREETAKMRAVVS